MEYKPTDKELKKLGFEWDSIDIMWYHYRGDSFEVIYHSLENHFWIELKDFRTSIERDINIKSFDHLKHIIEAFTTK